MLTITVEKSEGSRTSLKALVSSSKINSELVLFQVNTEERKCEIEGFYPNYSELFGLNDDQKNDLELTVQNQADKYAFGNSENGGFRSMLQTTQSCKSSIELSWKNA